MWATRQDCISVRIRPDGDVYTEPDGFIPRAGLRSFWDSLGVHEGDEERLWGRWMEGDWVPVAPAFPVLSELIQMEIDVSWIEAVEIPDLLRELENGRANCSDPNGLAVFDALKTCAIRALSEAKGIVLSPMG